MKRSITVLVALALLLALLPCAVYANDADEAPRYSYRTRAYTYQDNDSAAYGLTASVSLPYYMGTVNAVLETRLGEAESRVMVIYLPNDKWDGDCAYGVVTARLKPYGISVFPGSDLVIAWKDLYTYGFLDTEGGLYSFDKDTMIMHFTAGPGLYTGVAAIPVSVDPGEQRTYEQALREAQSAGEELDYLPIGFNFVLALDDNMIDYFLENGKLEKISNYDWPGLRELIESARYEVKPVDVEPDEPLFKIHKMYIRGQYLDLPYYVTNWFDPYIGACTSYGMIGGYTDGTFRANDSMTVAECLTIACRLHDVYNNGSGSFPSGGAPWYSVYVNYAVRKGIIRSNEFDDYDAPVTRAQAAYIFANAVPSRVLQEVYAAPRFSDVNNATPHRTAIRTLYQAGVVCGYEDGTFRPEQDITRAEICVIVSKFLEE